MKKMTRLMFAALIFSLAFSSRAGLITADLTDKDGDWFKAKITIEDTTTQNDINSSLNRITFVLDVSSSVNAGLDSADILGIWLDILDNDGSVVSALNTAAQAKTLFQNFKPEGYSILESVFSWNEVGAKPFKDKNVNLKGLEHNYDIAIQVGGNGGQDGKNAVVKFDMVLENISIDLFASQSIGLRVQSINIGQIDDGSAKLIGSFTSPPPPGGGGDDNNVPEPSSIWLLVIGLLGGVFGVHRAWRFQSTI